MPLKQEALKGYNTYFIHYDSLKEGIKKLASIREHSSGREMSIYSSMPGVLFYSGDYLDGKHQPFGGLCLEAQFYPDFLNHDNFPESIIDPGKAFNETIKMAFSTFVPE
jgi:aldose 1-epimerase